MRTTLNIDQQLIQEIQEYSGIPNKTEVIHRALCDFLASLRRQKLKDAYGKLRFELDVKEFRQRELNE